MLTATQATERCSTERYQEIAQLLHYAKNKLLAKMPQQLKMVSYLRLCCTAMRKLHQQPGLADRHSMGETFDASYAHLLRDLCHHNPEWWKHCWLDDHGRLKADDPVIDQLLQPLSSFIAIYSRADSSN